MSNLPNNAKPILGNSDKFAAFINRSGDIAWINIYSRPSRYEIDFNDCVASYETLSSGATNSARREIRKLEGKA